MPQPNHYTIITAVSSTGDRVGVGCAPDLPEAYHAIAAERMGTHVLRYGESSEFDYYQEMVDRDPVKWASEKAEILAKIVAEASQGDAPTVMVLPKPIRMGGGDSLFKQYEDQYAKDAFVDHYLFGKPLPEGL